jgi:hypothetical protein
MIKLKHKTLIFFSGFIWLGIGVFLLNLGLRLLLNSIDAPSLPLLKFLKPYFGGIEYATIGLIAFSLGLGYFKGKYVFKRTVKRVVEKIRSLPNPASLASVYSWPYYLLIVFMMFLGFSMRYFNISSDIRGVIDVAVGAALIQGAMRYFRTATYDT